MIGFLKSAPAIERLHLYQIDPEYSRLRRQVFAGIFLGYAAYYLVRNNLAIAIPDILKVHPEYSKAALGTALTGSSLAYGVSKFLMGSISDRSNPRYFLPLGLLLSASIIAATGLVKGIYASLTLLLVLQTLNGWVQGMGWPACGKTMVHWFSTNERGTVVSVWNTAHNVGGGLVATFAGLGVLIFADWGATFYFNAIVAAGVALLALVLLRDTPQSCGLPPIEEHRNDYPPAYSEAHERDFTFRQIFLEHVLNNKYLWAIAVANAFMYFVRYGVVNWIPTYLQTAQGILVPAVERGLDPVRVRRDPRDHRLRVGVGQGLQEPPGAGHHPVHGPDPGGRGRLLAEHQRAAVDRLRGAHLDRLPHLRADHAHRPPRAGPRAQESRRNRRRVHRASSGMCSGPPSPGRAWAGSPTTGAGTASSSRWWCAAS